MCGMGWEGEAWRHDRNVTFHNLFIFNTTKSTGEGEVGRCACVVYAWSKLFWDRRKDVML